MASPPISLVLELARADKAGDPHAFSFKPQTYLLRRENGDYESVAIDWNQGLLEELAALQKANRNPDALAKLGARLREFLLPAGWAQQEATIQEAVHNGRRVIVSLRFAAAELYALPWELVTLKSTGQHIGELPGVLCQYEWPATETMPVRHVGGEAAPRVFFAWSAAGGAVPGAAHLQAIATACQAAAVPFDPARDVLENVSCRGLSDVLLSARQEGKPITILHLLCHGGAMADGFGLILDGENDESQRTSGSTLRQVLAPYADMVRLVVICACNSGNSGSLDSRIGSIAQALHRVGFAQVVASRYPLSLPGSVELTRTLYQELLRSPDAVGDALLAARRQLISDGTGLDWASVQLYARAEVRRVDADPPLLRPEVTLPAAGRHAWPVAALACLLLAAVLGYVVNQKASSGGDGKDRGELKASAPEGVQLAPAAAPKNAAMSKAAPRERVVLFLLDGVTGNQDLRYSDLRAILRSQVSALRSELQEAHGGAFAPLLGHFDVLTEPGHSPDLAGLETYWHTQPALELLSGAILSTENPPVARSEIYLGELRGKLGRSSVRIEVPIRKEAYGATADGYSLVTLYALAMEAQRIGLPIDAVADLLARAHNRAANLKEKQASFEDLPRLEQAIAAAQDELRRAGRDM